MGDLKSGWLRTADVVFRVWLQNMEKSFGFNYERVALLHYSRQCPQPCKTHL